MKEKDRSGITVHVALNDDITAFIKQFQVAKYVLST